MVIGYTVRHSTLWNLQSAPSGAHQSRHEAALQQRSSMEEAVPARTPAEASPQASNRSLERGLRILRAFRPGSTVLGNSDIADSTGLPRSTVSRLTQTLVACGFLQHDPHANAYRLGPPVLSLAEALLSGSEFLEAARPHLRELAGLHVNVSIAVADQYEMVYLDTLRNFNSGLARRSSAGRRTPMELTAFGRAHLASLAPAERRRLMAEFRKRHVGNWERIQTEVNAAIVDVERKGYCTARWLEGVTAIATPIRTHERGETYVFGLSAASEPFERRLQKELLPAFLAAAEKLRASAAALQPERPARRR